MTTLLDVQGIGVAYGTAEVLRDLSLHVDAGESVTLIGANGAGKTSCLRAISGLEPLTAGHVTFAGERLDTLTPRQRLELGLVHVPEGKRLFPRMTVRENLAMGAFLRGDKASVKADIDAMCDRFPILRARQKQAA
ncbi:MAG: ATP-binding cassette domain-containing protein, partial [Proteobacteria bacterium]|nr:ATP-binding cassette domain-containing protein [Pseudomonadota bacterium]